MPIPKNFFILSILEFHCSIIAFKVPERLPLVHKKFFQIRSDGSKLTDCIWIKRLPPPISTNYLFTQPPSAERNIPPA